MTVDLEQFVRGLGLLTLAAVVYFIPTAVAWGKPQRLGVLALNLVLGWTVIGWFAALIWAYGGKAPTGFLCPRCRESVEPRATICPHCRSEMRPVNREGVPFGTSPP